MRRLVLALALVAPLAFADPPLRLSPGGQEVLKVPGLTKIAVGDSEIADVQLTGAGELLVLGKRRGRTSLTLWIKGRAQTRSVLVEDGRQGELVRTLQDEVNPSLKVETFNGRLIVDGTVDSIDEWRRLKALVGDDPTVKLLVKLNPRALPAIAQAITDALNANGLRDARAVAVGGKILLEGSVADSTERQKAETIAQAYYDDFARGGP